MRSYGRQNTDLLIAVNDIYSIYTGLFSKEIFKHFVWSSLVDELI